MELKVVRSTASEIEADAVVVLVPEGPPPPEFVESLGKLYESGEITGKFLEFTLLHGLEGYKAHRLLIAGTGKPETFDDVALRRVAGAAVRFLKPKGITSVVFVMGASPAVVEGAILGAWEPDYLKTDKSKER